jgi:acetyl-CoA acetyltransferase
VKIVSDKVYVIGMGMIKFGKNFDKTMKSMTGEALELAMKDCDLISSNIEAAWFSNSGWGMSDFQHCIRGQVALSANGIDKIPIINIENACAGGSTAFQGAWTAIKANLYDCALAIGTEKMYLQRQHSGKRSSSSSGAMAGFIAGTDVERTRKLIAQLKKQIQKGNIKAAKEKGDDQKQGKKEHSMFMDFYAMGARYHMKTYGTTQRQIAAIAAKNHNNSTMNPLAQYTFPQTIEQVMEDYVVAFPLTRAMCAPIGDGSAAAILCSEKFLDEHPNLRDRAVLIRASILRSGSWKRDNICKRASTAAFEISGLGPEDIDVAEVHDATAFGELHIIEQIGFCPVGKGGPFVENGATELDGKIPVNPSGGLLARGHPIGASGLAQIFELVTQLRGEAGKRQIKDPKIALAENGGGNIGAEEAALCIHILEKI